MLMERLEDNSQESVLSFYHVGPGVQTQVARLCGEYLNLLSYLTAFAFDFSMEMLVYCMYSDCRFICI